MASTNPPGPTEVGTLPDSLTGNPSPGTPSPGSAGGTAAGGFDVNNLLATPAQVIDFYSNIAKIAYDAGGIQFATSAMESFGTQLVLSVTDTLFTPIKALLTKSETLGEQTLEVASVIEGITGMTAAAINMAEFDADNVASKLSGTAYKAVSDLGDAQITLANGVKVSAAQFGDASDFLSSYSEAALRDSRLFRAAAESTNSEMLTLTRLAQRNLGLSTSEINMILQRELSETGKISGDFLRQYEKTVVAAAQAAGQPIELITKDLNMMMADFSHFGMMAETQMAALSVTVSKLGLNISDVTKLADNFQSFDKAAATMSNLAATTGATLDTLELFELANTDQEAFIISLRDQLESQGVEFEQMNFIQQKNIAAAFGLDPQVMKRLLSDNIDQVTSAQGEIAGKYDDLSDEDTQRFVATMKRLDDLSGENLVKRRAGMKAAAEEYAVSIEKSYLASAKITDQYVRAAGDALDAYGGQIKEYRKMLDTFVNESLNANPAVPAPNPPPQGASASPATTLAARETGGSVPAAPASPVAPPSAAPTATAPAAPSSGVGAGTSAPERAQPPAPTEVALRIEVNVTGTDGLIDATATAAGAQIIDQGATVRGQKFTVTVREPGGP